MNMGQRACTITQTWHEASSASILLAGTWSDGITYLQGRLQKNNFYFEKPWLWLKCLEVASSYGRFTSMPQHCLFQEKLIISTNTGNLHSP